MQGHSHCNMGVSPSGVDDRHRQKIIDQLEPDMFYLFMIWNKSLSVHTLIYDMARNVLCEDKDVDVKLLGDEDMDEFLDDAKEKVQKHVYKKSEAVHVRVGERDVDIDRFEHHSLYGIYGTYDLGGSAWRH